MKKLYGCLLICLLFWAGAVAAQTVVPLQPIDHPQSDVLSAHFSDYQWVQLDHAELYQVWQDAGASIHLSLTGIDRTPIDIQLSPYDMRSDRFVRQTWDGSRTTQQRGGKASIYKGFTQQDAHATALFTFDSQYIMGRWEHRGVTYFLEPLWHHDPTADHKIYFIYREQDARMPANFCGDHHSHHTHEVHETVESQAKVGECFIVEIALASDFELYQDFSSNATSVENFMLNTLANVQTNYDNEFADEIQFQVVTTYIATCTATTCDPWTNSTNAGTLLDNFTDWGNAGNFGVTYDVATLWSGRNFDGGTIGVAWLNGVCTGLRYNTCENYGGGVQQLRVLWAHELGHNFSAEHDPTGTWIMSPSVNTSTSWSPASIADMNAFIASRSCLENCGAIDPPLAIIGAPYEQACAGSTVPFFDESEGNVSSRIWSFEGGVPAVSFDAHPLVTFPNPGFYTVSLEATNAIGTDFTTFNIEIGADDFYRKILHFTNFENAGWTVENPDNQTTWEITAVGGNNGSRAAVINNYDYNAAGQIDRLVSPTFDFSAETDIELTFEYAYRRYSATLNDRLRVSISTNGGTSYTQLFEGNENGSGNFATGPDFTNRFTPATPGDWCFEGPSCVTLDLSPYAGQSNVVIKIENITGYGNYMYVNNIAITAACASAEPPVADFVADVNIGCAPLDVFFSDQSLGVVDFWNWDFPGGDPSFSDEPNPFVTYFTPGVYPVTLTVENAAGTDTRTQTAYIQVFEFPTTSFTFINTDNTYSFTNTSTGSIDTYFWDFGDGATSFSPNPVHTYTAPGEYTVVLQVSGECGTETFVDVITVEATLVADFGSDETIGCAPLTVNFIDFSTGDPTAWEWQFPGGTPSSSNLQNPTITYATPGVFDVSLTVSIGALSESITLGDNITVLAPPTAAFTATTTRGSLTVDLDDQSANGSSVTWDFGDGNTSATTPATYTYAAEGVYTITQTVENECGTRTATQEVVLLLPPATDFTADVTSGCGPLTVGFTSAPQGDGYTYAWTFEGGQPATSTAANPTVVYSTPGNYTVDLVVTNAAGATPLTQFDFITVLPQPVAAFTATAPLGSQTVGLEDQSTNANSVSWDFGDGTTSATAPVTYTYASEGVYTITQTVENECGTSTATQEVVLLLPPATDFTADVTSGCGPLSVDFAATPQGDGLTYAWTFAGGNPATSTSANPTVVYSTPGTYAVGLVVTNAAGATPLTQTDYITVLPQPVAAFVATATLGNLTVDLDDQSTNGNSVAWDFGDGTTSATTPATHTYAAEGVYTITQTVENECGTSTATQEVTLLLPPATDFTADVTSGCGPLSVDFAATPQGDGLTYAWTFAGGSPATSTSANPTVVYSTPGTYAVGLVVTNAAGATPLTQTDYISVLPQPVAAFVATATLGNLTVDLDDESTNGNSVAWDFGDGTTSATTPATHTYAAEGVYTITQTVENECGTSTATQEVTILLPPATDFTADVTSGCGPLSVDFAATPQGDGLTYAWTFAGGNPATSTSANPTVVYSTPGTYAVGLVVTNVAGATPLTQTDYITVLPQPTVDFGVVTVPGSLTVDFTAQTENATTWAWAFGDGTTASGVTASHTYATSGTYTVVLTATNACGSQMTTQLVTVLTAPAATFTASSLSVCPDETVMFVATEQGAGFAYDWLITGGTPSGGNTGSIVTSFAVPGSYTVALTVTNAAGTATIEQLVQVQPLPSPAFAANVNGLTATFFNNSQNATSYLWTFPDGSTSTETEPVFTFTETGEYQVLLTATNACGSSNYTGTVTLSGSIPMVGFTSSTPQGCAPWTVTFTSNTTGADALVWSFPGGTPATSTEPNPTVVYATPGTYNVTLNASNVFGSNAFSRTNWVVVPALATAQYTYTLDAVTATFAGTVSGATGFTWRFPDGTTSTEENPAYTFPGNGTYTVVLEAVGACNTAMYSEDIVIAGALPTVTMTASETSGCAPLTVTFRDQSANAPTAWQWAFPGGTPATSDAPEVTVTYPAAGTYDVVLTVSNLFGSSEETWSEQITVADVPATPTFSRATLDGVYYEFFVEAPQSGLRYVWDFGDGSTNEGVAVGHSFTATGTYTVELRAFNDCGDSEAASVTVTIIINSTDTPAWATGLVLAPNPTQGMLQLQATDWPQSGQLNYTLVNTLGQPLLRGHWATQPGAWTGALDLATLPAGAYWLQLRHAADVWVVKVVKQ